MKTFIFIAIALAIRVTDATLGFDGINSMSTSTFQCLSNSGYSFFIARVGHSTGAVDTGGIQNILNAQAAGWTSVDGYIFPSTSQSAATQVTNVINALSNAGAQIGTLWMDIEIYNWPSDKTSNQQFIQELVSTAQNAGYKVGIYSSNNNWASIVGSGWTGVSNLPLWTLAIFHLLVVGLLQL
uniref:Glycoside hydrolase family 25 protein n=1 Tax=Acrobeloides nanus TaxID=290746 RepID=A0A914CC40_9BILA